MIIATGTQFHVIVKPMDRLQHWKILPPRAAASSLWSGHAGSRLTPAWCWCWRPTFTRTQDWCRVKQGQATTTARPRLAWSVTDRNTESSYTTPSGMLRAQLSTGTGTSGCSWASIKIQLLSFVRMFPLSIVALIEQTPSTGSSSSHHE